MQNYLDNDDYSQRNRFKNLSGVSFNERPSSLNRASMQYADTDFDRMLMPDTYGSINEIVPLNDDEQFKHSSNVSGNTGIKRGFFAAIDNVFGGGHSSTA